jgi:hypothetical protein
MFSLRYGLNFHMLITRIQRASRAYARTGRNKLYMKLREKDFNSPQRNIGNENGPDIIMHIENRLFDDIVYRSLQP